MNRFAPCLFFVIARTATASGQTEHARFDFPVAIEGRQHILTYDATHDITKEVDSLIKLVVFVHHGGSQNPSSYFKYLTTALDAADRDRPSLNLKATTLVVSPGMIGPRHVADRPARYANGQYPVWNNGWREGADAVNAPAVSNFDLLDGMVRHVMTFYPNVKSVVHVGHSAGAQLLSRYALGSPVYDELRARGIYVRYIIANSSSLLYFDRQRPDLSTEQGFVDHAGRVPLVDGRECREFNTYKYGLDDLVPYMMRRPIAAMLASFRQRDVFMFQGLEDRDPMGSGVDRECPALLQGRFRLERGKRYYEYFGHFFGKDVYKTKFIAFAAGIAHSGGQMFLSERGKAIIFVNADSAAASLRP